MPEPEPDEEPTSRSRRHDDAPVLGILPVSFSLCGVQKAGTTTLEWAISRHRQVATAPRKEMHFFDDETRDWSSPDYTGYAADQYRPWQRVAGDATPIYLFWPHALERMRTYDPDLRLIASFRDPIDRAVSQWLMSRERHLPDALDWPDLMARLGPGVPAATPAPEDEHDLRTWEVFARGRYADQLERAWSVFPRDQWLLVEFGLAMAEFDATLDRITDFLGLHRYRRYPRQVRRMSTSEALPGTPPEPADIAALVDYYAEDLRRFAAMTGLDISRWTTQRLLEGSLTTADVARTIGAKLQPPG